MKNEVKIYLVILGISIVVLLLEAFIIKLAGVIGLSMCIISIFFIVG